MGTDIHGVFQRCDGSRWLDIDSRYNWNRHYKLFQVLSYEEHPYCQGDDLDGLMAIAPERGLPDDFAMRKALHPSTLKQDTDSLLQGDSRTELQSDVYMGWDGYSWLTGEEILAWVGNTFDSYILNRAEYEGWCSFITDPETHSLATEHDVVKEVRGVGIVLVDEDDLQALEREDWTHVRCKFRRKLREEFSYFFDEVARLIALHGRVRLVFGFD